MVDINDEVDALEGWERRGYMISGRRYYLNDARRGS